MTEHEINAMIQDPEILNSVLILKKEFVEKEAKFLKINDNDFLSLIFMTPSIALANADEDISMDEELDLTKKARKLSQGKYFFFENDPVVQSLEFLLKDINYWEEKFYTLIRSILNKYCHDYLESKKEEKIDMTEKYISHLLLSAPNLIVRFLVSMFLKDDEELLKKHKLTKKEFKKMQEIAEKLNINHLPVFHAFISKIKIKV